MEAAKKATKEGIPVHKEFPEGYKWMAAPDTVADAKALQYIQDVGCEGGWCTQGENLAKQYGGEGNQLYVLHDPSGKAVTQISVEKNQNPYPVSGEAFARLTGAEKAEYREHVMQWRRRNPDVEELTDEHTAQALKEAGVQPQPDRIVEIKGKRNAAPNEEYLPYVQDFVRSGKWSDVGDLQNTGLYRKSDFIDEFNSDQLDSTGIGEYLNINEIKSLRKGKPWKPIDTDPELDIDPNLLPPMKRGGPVNQDAMQMAVWNKAIRKGGGGRMSAAEMLLALAKKGVKAVGNAVEAKGIPDLPPAVGFKASEVTKPQSTIASKALDPFIGERLALTPSVADRMVARPGRSREKGGPMFPWLSTVDPDYAGWVWANKGKGKSTQMIRMADENPGLIFTPQFGDSEMHRSNQVTFERLLRAFDRAKAEGKLTPELEDAYNKRLTSFYKDVEGGKPLFSPEFSIGNLRASEAEAMSFPARAAIAEVLGGKGLREYGYKRQEAAQIIPYKRILDNMTEPSLVDAPTGSVGPRLFTLSGERTTDPKIHSAYPEIVGGKDLGVQYDVAPRDIIAHEFVKKIQESKGRPPGHMDWDRNSVIMPIDREMILRLQDAGYKKGGKVQKKAAGGMTSDDLILEERRL